MHPDHLQGIPAYHDGGHHHYLLRNNPNVDTAADIAELRMLSKGQVSQAVESLVRKGLVRRQPDASDRRRIHLLLCEKSIPVTDSIDAIQRQFLAGIFDGFSENEMECFAVFMSGSWKMSDGYRKKTRERRNAHE